MNVDELHEEMEGSKRDIQEACDSVDIVYYHTTQPWMQQPIQAAFVIHIKHPTSSSCTLPTVPVSPLTLYAAAAMPHGYQRIHLATSDSAGAKAINERTAFTYDSDATYYPTLNGVMMTHSGQYRSNKEDEMTRKLQLLAVAHGDDDGDG